MSFVNPVDVVDPNAEPLTDEGARVMLEDSWRPRGVFIKDHMDPNYKRNTEGALFEDKEGERGYGVITYHVLRQPVIKEDRTKVIGYFKLRGPPAFANEDDAHEYGTHIFKSHDSYSRMIGVPMGTMQPIVVTELTPEENALLDSEYKKHVESQKAKEDEYVLQQRLAERTAREATRPQKEKAITEYVRQQLRWHAATFRMQKMQKLMEQAESVLAASKADIDKMLAKNPEWEKEGLEFFKAAMVQAGEKEPETYFDQNVPEKPIEDLPGFFL